MSIVPNLMLSDEQVLWLSELGVSQLWGRPLQANRSVSVEEVVKSVVPMPSSQEKVATGAHETFVDAENIASESPSLIKHSSPEGRTKSGRMSKEKEKALKEIHAGIERTIRQSKRKDRDKQISVSPPSLTHVSTWDDLVDEIQRYYIQNAWIQESTEMLIGQVGNQPCRLMIIEEVPGVDDILAQQAFAGDAGELLSNMLKPLGLDRQDVAMTSLLKFIPDEVTAQHYANCIPFLQAQIQLLKPQCIWLLGSRVAQSFLQQDNCPIQQLRAQSWHYPLSETQQIPVMVSHHPSLLLVNPVLKAEVWEDLQRLVKHVSA